MQSLHVCVKIYVSREPPLPENRLSAYGTKHLLALKFACRVFKLLLHAECVHGRGAVMLKNLIGVASGAGNSI